MCIIEFSTIWNSFSCIKERSSNLIPNVTNDASWKALTTGAYCWYNNDAINKITYGALYNWYAVVDSRNLAPTGWHVPTYAELTILTDLLGGEGGAGGKMKEAGLAHWLTPNTDATNSSGFTALPGGSRDYYGTCMYFGIGGWWWSSTGWPSYPETSAYYLGMGYNMAGVGSSNNSHSSKYYGFSVRCLRD